jgi:hypothetical protein
VVGEDFGEIIKPGKSGMPQLTFVARKFLHWGRFGGQKRTEKRRFLGVDVYY